jgi:hypothetical protein
VATKIYQIVQSIPQFIQEVKIAEDDSYKFFGSYHLGSNHEIQGSKNSFRCEEQDPTDQSVFYKRVCVLTELCMLIYEPCQSNPGEGILMAWATLLSLNKLNRFMDQKNLITFNWR